MPPPNVTGSLHLGRAPCSRWMRSVPATTACSASTAKWILAPHAGIATTRGRARAQVRGHRSKRGQQGVHRPGVGVGAGTARSRVDPSPRGRLLRHEDERFTLDRGPVCGDEGLSNFLPTRAASCRDRYLVKLGSGPALGHLQPEVRGARGSPTLYAIAYPVIGGGEVVAPPVRPENHAAGRHGHRRRVSRRRALQAPGGRRRRARWWGASSANPYVETQLPARPLLDPGPTQRLRYRPPAQAGRDHRHRRGRAPAATAPYVGSRWKRASVW